VRRRSRRPGDIGRVLSSQWAHSPLTTANPGAVAFLLYRRQAQSTRTAPMPSGSWPVIGRRALASLPGGAPSPLAVAGPVSAKFARSTAAERRQMKKAAPVPSAADSAAGRGGGGRNGRRSTRRCGPATGGGLVGASPWPASAWSMRMRYRPRR
jgi:hypothetical protein